MAKINFDIAKKLDITCRRGDSFSLELTLKDSSGIAINLHGGTAATFRMRVTTPLGTPASSVVYPISTTGYQFATSTAINPSLTDDENSTTADTSDSSYVASTAASGVVKFELSALKMQLTEALALSNSVKKGNVWNFVYDIVYVDNASANYIDGVSNAKTILYGNFFIKDDTSLLL
jgi:hypothetical protein